MSVCCHKCGMKLVPNQSHNCIEDLKEHITKLESKIESLINSKGIFKIIYKGVTISEVEIPFGLEKYELVDNSCYKCEYTTEYNDCCVHPDIPDGMRIFRKEDISIIKRNGRVEWCPLKIVKEK